MDVSPSSVRRRRMLMLLLLVVCGTTACESLTLRREPERVRVHLDSPDADEINLVTSRWFLRVPDPECPVACVALVQLVEADTTVVPLPYTSNYPLNFRLQFFAEAYPVLAEPTTLTMIIHVDDREWYNDSRTLQPEGSEGSQETLRFVYEYNVLGVPN